MANVRPMRGFHYHPKVDLNQVITPPYDVISIEDQSRYYERHSLNSIRLEFGQEMRGDDQLENRYTRAAATFARWRLEGVLQHDAHPTMTVLQQEFTHDGQSYRRTTLLARVRLEPWEAGVILPHEQTMTKPKNDRLQLLRACGANFSPILSLYSDPDQAIESLLAQVIPDSPARTCVDDAGIRHSLWTIGDQATVTALTDLFASQQLFIADGHHRYETALQFREEVRELQRGLHPDEAANFVLMGLISLDDPGVVVLPTHRLIRGVTNAQRTNLAAALSTNWEIEELDTTASTQELLTRVAETGATSATGAADTVTALVADRDHRWLIRQRPEGVQRMASRSPIRAWQQLDTAVIQELVIDAAFGITQEAVAGSEQISYSRDAAQTLHALETGAADVTILLNPTRPEQIREVALVGGRMPQKSTYFTPKIGAGLVINPLW